MAVEWTRVYSAAYHAARRAFYEEVYERWKNRLGDETFERYLENKLKSINESEAVTANNYAN